MERGVAKAIQIYNEIMQCLFKLFATQERNSCHLINFIDCVFFFVSVKANMIHNLYFEKSCAECFSILFVVQNKMMGRIRDSKFYDVIIDESTNIPIISHLVDMYRNICPNMLFQISCILITIKTMMEWSLKPYLKVQQIGLKC